MTIAPLEDPRFAFDKADRLRRSLRVSGVSVQEMADELEMSRNSVSAWINGRTEPSTPALRVWALKTGFPYKWLVNGETPPPSGDGASNSGRLRESNSRPIHYMKPSSTRIAA